MKTILIAHNYSEISFASMSYKLSHYLANLGHRVIFISHDPYFEQEQNFKIGKGQIAVLSWPSKKRPTGLKEIIWFSKLYLKYKPEVIIGHFVGSNISVMMSKILSIGQATTFEYYHTLSTQLSSDYKISSVKRKLLFFRKKIFYSLFCDTIICPSDMAKLDLASYYSVRKATVLLNPMIDRFKVKEFICDKNIVISYLGRLENSKGILDLIFAFLKYKNEYYDSKIILQIAGNGSLESEVIEAVKNQKDIRFLGNLAYTDIDFFLNKSHYCIIPSKSDAFNVVGLEAMMNGTPLLISTGVGLADYLTDELQCFKFNPAIEDMILVLRKVEMKFELQEIMSGHARATFLKQFSMESYCQDFYKMLN